MKIKVSHGAQCFVNLKNDALSTNGNVSPRGFWQYTNTNSNIIGFASNLKYNDVLLNIC